MRLIYSNIGKGPYDMKDLTNISYITMRHQHVNGYDNTCVCVLINNKLLNTYSSINSLKFKCISSFWKWISTNLNELHLNLIRHIWISWQKKNTWISTKTKKSKKRVIDFFFGKEAKKE
jgi:hypothetical protein